MPATAQGPQRLMSQAQLAFAFKAIHHAQIIGGLSIIDIRHWHQPHFETAPDLLQLPLNGRLLGSDAADPLQGPQHVEIGFGHP